MQLITPYAQIKLAECSKLTDRSIIALAHHCPLILEFDLQNLPGMTDKSMREVWTHSTYLRELRLTGNEIITDAGFPRLKTLPNNGWKYATVSAEEARETSHKNREIDADCRNAPKVDSFPYLRTVDLTGCTGISDEAIASIIAAAPKIRALTLAKCVNLTDASIDSVAKLGKQLHYLHAAHLNQ
jgi:F-box and leucine-rich repeat protein GRR1